MKICSSKFIALVFVPVLLSAVVLVYRAHPFHPAPFPLHEFTHREERRDPALVDARMLDRSHFVGSPHLQGPEDLVYDSNTGLLYTGCVDGWIKTFDLNASVLRNWINTGGRPLGVALSGSQLIVADAYQGLLRITEDKKIEVLTNAAEGLKFNLTDGVDVGKDGTIYFTDASYKYQFHDYLYDILEGRPHGRLLSFNPNTNETKVLLHNLYFPNGVAISPDQSSLVFCETPLKRCRRYWLQGSKKGSVETFIDNIPGFPDNIHCDGENYWIAISSSLNPYLEYANKLQFVRKVIIIVESYLSLLKHVQKNGGVYGVDLQGNPTAHFYDPALSLLSGAVKIGNQIYVGSLQYPHIIGFNMSKSQIS
ncbi:protein STRICTOSIDINE SYNTHASE-LIKE 6-like [Silene latifolia]|uniref:protein STRICTOSIDINE SYNTHASE-LIKE 6-like n=1 Tax=Silene latifolia TaxID=37657 RepID=UPI003D77A553